MASLDISAAFEMVVNIDLFMKRLSFLGLPIDILSPIEIWHRNKMFHVEIVGQVLKFFNTNHGKIQGSILGPVLYASYVPPPLWDQIDILVQM